MIHHVDVVRICRAATQSSIAEGRRHGIPVSSTFVGLDSRGDYLFGSTDDAGVMSIKGCIRPGVLAGVVGYITHREGVMRTSDGRVVSRVPDSVCRCTMDGVEYHTLDHAIISLAGRE